MKKLINFKQMQMIRDIQDYANANFDGNFTEAVVNLCRKALSVKAQ